MRDKKLIKEAIAFAIEYADNCHIPDNYSSDKGYPDVDWLSDWGAYLADAVFDELVFRKYSIKRDSGRSRAVTRKGAPVGSKRRVTTADLPRSYNR